MDILVDHPTIIERCAQLGLSIDQVKRLAGEDHTLRDLAFMLALNPDTLAPVRPKCWLWMAAQTCSVSYRHELTPERLQTALVSGVVEPADETTFHHFLDEAPLSVVFMAGQQAAQQSGVSPAQIWSNIDRMAAARSSVRLRSLENKNGERAHMIANVTLTNTGFRAVLDDGRTLENDNVEALASSLYGMGLRVDDVHCGDWREGDHILPSGEQIALKVALRKLENPAVINSSH